MTFLYPFALLGLIGVAAPIWLHLRRRHRTNVRKFSALRFLDDQPAPRDMPLQLRNWPLFLLRLLAFLLAALALAWPYFPAVTTPIGSETRIYILDNTLSHRVGGAFDRAKRELAREVRSAGPATQVGVIEVAAQCRIVAELGSDPVVAAAAVEALSATHQRGNYLEAFRLAAAMLDRSLGEKRRIFVYGDRQRNQWEENLNVPPFLENVEVILAEPPGRNEAGNLYTANTRVRRTPSREGSMTELTLDLGAQQVNQGAQIVVRSGGKEVLSQALKLEAGQATVQTSWTEARREWVRGEVTLKGRPDVLPEDDRSFFAIPPLVPGKIGLMARSPYLRASLDPEICEGIWDVTRLSPAQIRTEAAADHPRFDALVVESDYLQSAEVRELILRHLNNGRGLLLFVSRTTPLIEGFLRTFGYRGEEPVGAAGEGAPVRYAALMHPALSAFARPDFGDLLAVRWKKWLPLKADQADPLIFADSGEPLMFETRGTKGRMLVFGFDVDAEWTNWPLRPDFLPFLDGCLTHVRAAPEIQTSLEPGEVLYREFSERAGRPFALVGPAGIAAQATADEAGRLRIAVPDEPGIYELRLPDRDELIGLVSVSPPARESALDYILTTPGALTAWQVEDAPAKTETVAPAVVTQTRLDQTLWWWLLLGGAIFLLGEMIWMNAKADAV